MLDELVEFKHRNQVRVVPSERGNLIHITFSIHFTLQYHQRRNRTAYTYLTHLEQQTTCCPESRLFLLRVHSSPTLFVFLLLRVRTLIFGLLLHGSPDDKIVDECMSMSGMGGSDVWDMSDAASAFKQVNGTWRLRTGSGQTSRFICSLLGR